MSGTWESASYVMGPVTDMQSFLPLPNWGQQLRLSCAECPLTAGFLEGAQEMFGGELTGSRTHAVPTSPNPGTLHPSCVTLSSSLLLSEPQFPLLEIEV